MESIKRTQLCQALVLAVAIALAGCGESPKPVQHQQGVAVPAEPIPLGPLPRNVTPTHYRIALTVDPTKDSFSGHVEIDVDFKEKRRAIFLHGRDLNVLAASVRLNARHSIPAHYMQVDKSGVARLIFVDEVPAGKATLVFDYEAQFGKSLSGLYKVVDRGDAYAFTQFESISAREAFPSFDEPGFKTPFQLEITAPNADKVVSNTPVQWTRPAKGGTETIFQWTRPLPTYLIALAVGPLDIVDGGDIPPDGVRSRPIHLRGVTARGNGPRIRYALSLTPKIIAALENYFGIAYPFQKLDVLAVPDFAAGAMENAGAVTFRERLMLLEPDASIDQKRSTLSVQAHELTHQWFGDLVTPAWWDDTWLNESFADWMENKIAQQALPDEQFDTETLRSGAEVMDTDELAAAREIRQPVHNPDDIENAFDSITYNKGAAVLSMFEGYLGDDLFRRGIHAYLTKFASRNATEQDFIGTIAQVAATEPQAKPENVAIAIDAKGAITWNGHSVTGMGALMDQLSHMSAATAPGAIAGAFSDFIDQPGIPELKLQLQCNGAALARVSQTAYSPIGRASPPRQWRVPACLSVPGQDKYCRLVDRRSEDVFLGASCPAVLIPNDEGRGYYRYDIDPAGRAALIKQIATLDPADQISLLTNLSSGMHAGELGAGEFLQAVQNVAPTARWDVLAIADEMLHALRLQSGVSGGDLVAYQSFVRHTFSARLADVGLDARNRDKAAAQLARGELAKLLVSEGRDPQTIATLAAAATAYLQGAPNTLPPELVGEGLRAGVIAGGQNFAKLLLKTYQTTDQEFLRRQIVYAVAASDDPSVIRSFLALALTPHMRGGEIRYLFELLPDEPTARATLWSWFKSNYDGMLARLSRDRMGHTPQSLQTACDAASRSDLDSFLGPKTVYLTGTARPLALAEQKIGRCIAFRQAKGQEIAAALHKLAP